MIVAACPAPRRDDASRGDSSRQPAAEPAFELGLWPGEGIPVIHAAVPELPLRQAPRGDASVVDTLKTRPNENIPYDSTRFLTLTPAPVRATAPTSIRGRYVGAARSLSRADYYGRGLRDTVVQVSPGTTLEYLQHRAEGTCFVRVNGAVLDADPCLIHDTTAFRVSGQPVTEWWIHVNGPSARGWIRLGDSSAKVVTRRY